jgi:DNA modification methylase
METQDNPMFDFSQTADLDDDEVASSARPILDCEKEKAMEVDLFGNTPVDKLPGGAMCQRFIEPPFTTLDQRTGRWQDRKRDWMALGIQSEMGRGDDLLKFSSAACSGYGKGENVMPNTSLFDPCLCELIYSWLMPEKPALGILDPFAGGSVRGIVAGRLGYQYVGVELRQEQVDANVKQALDIPCSPNPHWICGDSVNLESMVGDEYDLLFTCPPYWNLERYSDDRRDLSTLDNWNDFVVKYQRIMLLAARRLKSQRFAVVVVGNIRDDEGFIRDMRQPTASALLGAGFKLYNEFILLTPIGSLPLRVNGQFAKGRKAGSAHQYVMCFFRGNPDSIRYDFTEFDQ